ncbi:MAG TPA: hypothetical protein VFL99_08310 [Segeticoccus sp.]|uniref:hypothetical protein n=1 Tax=Segeticoccus sp. TaxID=2706531 RepID=UPI002D7E8368|nr:hypothetical protein [Segeticoccus sp.]HET8600314.1 hypothetical protein [Segeticoccus sp.]
MVTALLAGPAPLPEPAPAELPLDANERAAVGVFVRAGLVETQEADGLRARREPWGAYRAVS